MSNKHLVILITALNPSAEQITSFGEKRIRQYELGLQKIGELSESFPGFDYAIVDNTIRPDWSLPPAVELTLQKIPNLKRIFFFDNELGARNKGSGVVVDLKRLAKTVNLENYDYCVYYEPRQELLNFDFFRIFTKNPGNYARFIRYRITAVAQPKFIQLLFKIIPVFRKQINISLFSAKSKILVDYLKQADEKRMAEDKVSMEDDFYKFIKHMHFVDLPRLGVRWHNAAADKYVEY